MYFIGFTLAWLLAKYRAKRPDSGWTAREVDDFITIGAAAVGRSRDELFALFDELDKLTRSPFAKLKQQIDEARAAKDYAASDAIRDELIAALPDEVASAALKALAEDPPGPQLPRG